MNHSEALCRMAAKCASEKGFSMLHPAFLIASVFAAGLLITVGVLKGKGSTNKTTRILAGALLIAVCGGISFWILSAQNSGQPETIRVPAVQEDDYFTLNLPHEFVQATHNTYDFTTNKSWVEIVGELDVQQPDGVIQNDGTWLQLDPWVPARITQPQDPDGAYRIQMQISTLAVEDAGSPDPISFAYPVYQHEAIQFDPGQPLAIEPGFKAKATDFYRGIRTAAITETGFEVPGSHESTIRLTITDTTITAEQIHN